MNENMERGVGLSRVSHNLVLSPVFISCIYTIHNIIGDRGQDLLLVIQGTWIHILLSVRGTWIHILLGIQGTWIHILLGIQGTWIHILLGIQGTWIHILLGI